MPFESNKILGRSKETQDAAEFSGSSIELLNNDALELELAESTRNPRYQS